MRKTKTLLLHQKFFYLDIPDMLSGIFLSSSMEASKQMNMEFIYATIYAGFAFFVARFAQYAFLRSFLAWFILSLLFTPVISFIFLLAAGIPVDKIIRDEIKQKALKKYGETVNLQTVEECPYCSEVFDISQGLGIINDEHESWKIYCENCKREIHTQSLLKNLSFPVTVFSNQLQKGRNTMNEQYKLSPEDLESAQFFSLVLSLSNSAMLAMGKSPNPITGKIERDLAQAQETIDLLGMLKNKTQGNLTDKEKILLENTLTSLRLTCAKELEREEKSDKPPQTQTPGDQNKQDTSETP